VPCVGQFRNVADQEDVARFHVAVLETNPAAIEDVLAGVQEIESVGHLPHVEAKHLRFELLAQFVLVNLHQVEERGLGQFHVDDDVAGQRPDGVVLDEVRVFHQQERLERPNFPCRADRVGTRHELEGDGLPIWTVRFPNFSKAPATANTSQSIPRRWLCPNLKVESPGGVGADLWEKRQRRLPCMVSGLCGKLPGQRQVRVCRNCSISGWSESDHSNGLRHPADQITTRN
jgi:hypothetical protein